jgi:folate-binding protein YgfZ
VSFRGRWTSPETVKVQVARSTFGTDPAWRTGHFSVRYWPGGRRAGSYPASATLASAFDLNRGTLPRLTRVLSVSVRAAPRPRSYVRVAGPDAEDYLQRMLSNDVTAGELVDALLLTPKGRLIAPLRAWRRGAEDFLLLTEPELGEVVRATLLRSRFAAKCEIELEEHTSAVVFGEAAGLPGEIPGTVEVLDRTMPGGVEAADLERARIEAAVPAWGKELDDSILPAEAGLDETHISFTKGCYPGQEPIARLRNRGHVNRRLRVLEVGSASAGDEIDQEGKTVGRVTSAVPGLALGYVRVEVPDVAELEIGGSKARLH